MRALVLILAVLALPQCASGGGGSPQPGAEPESYVIIGVAESSEGAAPSYSMLWRLLDERGAFTEYDDARALEARTNAGATVRVRGIPGEFAVLRAQPGVYALDSVFAQLREDRLSYIAQGVIEGPARPAFEISPGETVYLGIWEMNIDGANAVTRLWRMSEGDARAVIRASRRPIGNVILRETHLRPVACRPRAMNSMSQRQIC